MQDTLQTIPPEAWPWLDLLFNLTCAAAAVWLATTVFVMWRRHESNLTPINAAERNSKAQPDFLKVDKKARAEAIARGEGFDKELERRVREEERMKAEALHGPKRTQSIAGWISFILALVSLLMGVLGVIFSIVRLEDMATEFGSWERILSLFRAYPIPFTVAVTVIILKISHFVLEHRKTKEG